MGLKKNLAVWKLLFVAVSMVLLVGCGKGLPQSDRYNLDLFYDPVQDETYVVANGNLLQDTIPGEVDIYGESIEGDRFLIGLRYSDKPLYMFDRGELYSICESVTHGGLSSEGTMVYYFDPEGTLFLYDVETKETIKVCEGMPMTGNVVLSPNGTHMLYKEHANAELKLYKKDTFVCSWQDYKIGMSVSDDASVIYARNDECTTLFSCTTDGRSDYDYITVGRLSIQREEFCRTAIYKNRTHTELIAVDGPRMSFAKNGHLYLLANMNYDYNPEHLLYRPSTDWVETYEMAEAYYGTAGVCDIDTFVDGVINRGDTVLAIRESTNPDPYASKFVAEEAGVDEDTVSYPDRNLIIYKNGGNLYRQKLTGETSSFEDETYLCNTTYSDLIAEGVADWRVKGNNIYYVDWEGNLYHTNPSGLGNKLILDNVRGLRGDYNKSAILCKTQNGGKEELYLVSGMGKTKLPVHKFPGISGVSEAYDEMFTGNLIYVIEKAAGGTESYLIDNGKATCFLETEPMLTDAVVWTELEEEPEAEAEIELETEPEEGTEEEPADEEPEAATETIVEWDGSTITITGQVYQSKYWDATPEDTDLIYPLSGAKIEAVRGNPIKEGETIIPKLMKEILWVTESDKDGFYTVKVPADEEEVILTLYEGDRAFYTMVVACDKEDKELDPVCTIDRGLGIGRIGESVRWRLGEDGELLITGEGDVSPTEEWDPKLVRSIIVEQGIRSLGTNCFGNCINLTSVQLPDSLERIGDGAFWGCKSLTEITLPDGVKSLGKKAFGDCEGLKSIVLGESVAYLDEFALGWCTALTEIVWPISLNDFHDDAFYDTRLIQIYYAGNEEQWQEVKKTDYFADATVLFDEKEIRKQIGTPNADEPIALNPNMSETEREQLQQGAIVTIGKWRNSSIFDYASPTEEKPIEWIILEENDGRLLLLSRYALYLSEHIAGYGGVSEWDQSAIRNWVGGTFIYEAFTKEERNMLQYPPSKEDSLNEEDKFFLLTVEEYRKYYDLTTIRTCPGTAYTDSLIEDAIDHHEHLFDQGSWWVDSGKQEIQLNARCYYISSEGTVEDSTGDQKRLVRLATWVDIAN